MKLIFNDLNECVGILEDDVFTTETTHLAPEWVLPSTLALRIKLENGAVVDRYSGLSDEQALEQHVNQQEADNASRAASFSVSQDQFLFWLGAERRIVIRTLAKTDVVVEDFMDMLNRNDSVGSEHPELIAALAYLESLGDPKLQGLYDDFLATGNA